MRENKSAYGVVEPLIVGEDCMTSSTVVIEAAPEEDRLLATPEAQIVLLSMSGFGKRDSPFEYPYGGASQPLEEAAYATLNQPSYQPQYEHSPAGPVQSQAGEQQATNIAVSQLDLPSEAFTEHYSSFSETSPASLPKITHFSPQSGTQGAHFYIYIHADFDFLTPATLQFQAIFGNKRCGLVVAKLDSGSASYDYVLSAAIPSLEETSWLGNPVPVHLDTQSASGRSLQVLRAGDFTFESIPLRYQSHGQSEHSRKRKASVEAGEYVETSPKRVAREGIVSKPRHSPSTRHGVAASMAPAGSSYMMAGLSDTFGLQRPFDQPSTSPRPQHLYGHNTGTTMRHQLSPHSTTSIPTPSLTSLSPYQQAQSPALSPYHGVSRGEGLSSPPNSNPPLIRTSTIQTGSGHSGTPLAGTPSFNPYSMYPNSRAMLTIDGDLDSMCDDWTRQEWETKRRLVQFRRSQSGSTITTQFQPVTPEERAPNSICISCIWWEERQQSFVTSVDTIYLLESLVAVRFTVEEKNRIRRNLEGFRPLTVSKGKSESEDFFKIIMGFPNPKPRNIEKDVKVFPWKILAHALKKIIGKYSASYSSTAGAFFPSSSAGYVPAGLAESTSMDSYLPTPSTRSSATGSSGGDLTHIFQPSLTSAGISPEMRLPQGLEGHIEVAIPSTEDGGAMSSHWATSDQSQSSLRPHQHQQLLPQPRSQSQSGSQYLSALPGGGRSPWMLDHFGGGDSAAYDRHYGQRTSRE